MKSIVLLLLAAIAISLFSGLFFLTRKDSEPEKLLRALKVRVALSIALIVLLVISYQMGFIAP